MEINQSSDILYKKKRNTDMWTLQRNQQLAAYSRIDTKFSNYNTVTNKQKVSDWQACSKIEWTNEEEDGVPKKAPSLGEFSPKKSGYSSDSGVSEKKDFLWSGSESDIQAPIQRSNIVTQSLMHDLEQTQHRERSQSQDSGRFVEQNFGAI